MALPGFDQIRKTVGELFGGLYGRGNRDKVHDTNLTESVHAVLARQADELRAMGMLWRESTPPGTGVWEEGPGVVCSDPVLIQNRIAELDQAVAAARSQLRREESLSNWAVDYGPREFARAWGVILSKCGTEGVSGVVGNVASELGVTRNSLVAAGAIVGLVLVGTLVFYIVKKAVR